MMADQLADLFEGGIPHDVVIARAEAAAFRDEAATSASAAANSAAAAGAEATASAISAQTARKYAEQRVDAVTVDEEPPVDENRRHGKVWVEVDGTDVLTLNVWDVTDPGHALSPSASLSPSSNLSPADAGAWQTYNFPTA